MSFVKLADRINALAAGRLGEDCEVLTDGDPLPLRGIFYTPYDTAAMSFGVVEEPGYRLVVEEYRLVDAPLTIRGKVRVLGKVYTVVDVRSEEYGLVTFILRLMA